ncbi:hypothetical protein ACFWXO_43030 [Kitasatospora sp. NPDC059088]|uniref:hypothetical protein n=1 Tax=Kitasatospora sp. NPDC059088 TaxID=3346722 RepID=UPI0036B1DCC7
MLATSRTSAAPTVTGRSFARRVASLTGGSRRMPAGAWVAEARGAERSRRAVVCRIGRLTGTRAPRWSGEIGGQEWQTILMAGVAALAEASPATGGTTTDEPAKCSTCGVRLNRSNTGTLCGPCHTSANAEPVEAPVKKQRREPDMRNLGDTAREFAKASTNSTGGDRVVDRTRNGRVEALVAELLAARPTSALHLVGDDERRLVETWSPFRNGPRWSETRRALSGPRRGNDEPLSQH